MLGKGLIWSDSMFSITRASDGNLTYDTPQVTVTNASVAWSYPHSEPRRSKGSCRSSWVVLHPYVSSFPEESSSDDSVIRFQLSSKWREIIITEGTATLDLPDWLNKATLDAIGEGKLLFPGSRPQSNAVPFYSKPPLTISSSAWKGKNRPSVLLSRHWRAYLYCSSYGIIT